MARICSSARWAANSGMYAATFFPGPPSAVLLERQVAADRRILALSGLPALDDLLAQRCDPVGRDDAPHDAVAGRGELGQFPLNLSHGPTPV